MSIVLPRDDLGAGKPGSIQYIGSPSAEVDLTKPFFLGHACNLAKNQKTNRSVLTSLPVLTRPPTAKAFRIRFWMMKFSSPSPKRTMVVSNSRTVASLDLGKLRKSEMVTAPENQTTKKYVDGGGRQRYAGLPALKRSQKLSGNGFPVSVFVFWTVLCGEVC